MTKVTSNSKGRFFFSIFVCFLKVSKSQNKFMKSSFLSKNEQNIARISALTFRAESLQYFVCFLGEMMTSWICFEIYWPLVLSDRNSVSVSQFETDTNYGIGAVTSSAETETVIYWFFRHGISEMTKPVTSDSDKTSDSTKPYLTILDKNTKTVSVTVLAKIISQLEFRYQTKIKIAVLVVHFFLESPNFTESSRSQKINMPWWIYSNSLDACKGTIFWHTLRFQIYG